MVRPFPEAATAGLIALVLAGCGDARDVARPATTPPPPLPSPGATDRTPATSTPSSLTPLTTPEQVIDSLDIGRPDPFAPIRQGASRPAAAPELPSDLRLTGVIGRGGDARAFVQRGNEAGALCLGSRGRCADGASNNVLLPPGWRVSSIDAVHAQVVFSFGRQPRVLNLMR